MRRSFKNEAKQEYQCKEEIGERTAPLVEKLWKMLGKGKKKRGGTFCFSAWLQCAVSMKADRRIPCVMLN